MEAYTKQQLEQLDIDELKRIAKSLNVSIRGNCGAKTLQKRIIEKQDKLTTESSPSVKEPEKFSMGQQLELDASPNTSIIKKTVSENIIEKNASSNTTASYYIQIHKSNLLSYFASALIYPINYEIRELARTQRENDIQNLAPDYLILTKGFADELAENQVILEVILTESETNDLKLPLNNIFLLSHPLPISRVQKIYFLNESAQNNAKAIANTFDDAFLPEHLFECWTEDWENYSEIVYKLNPQDLPKNEAVKIEEKEQFNRILGMLAFMKNADLYYTNETGKFSNYSEDYFKVLHLMNDFFTSSDIGKLENSLQKYYQTLLKPKKAILSLLNDMVSTIYADVFFRQDVLAKLALNYTSDNQKQALEFLVRDETQKAIETIDQTNSKINPELILLIFLYRFRDKSGNDKFILKKQLSNLINLQKLNPKKAAHRVSIVLATLGLYYGYRNLPKDEKIILEDEFYTSFSSQNKFNIKYKLDNSLDHTTIESVFQYCFFPHQKETKFDYLPQDENRKSFEFNQETYQNQSFTIQDQSIIRLQKEKLTEEQIKIKENLMTFYAKYEELKKYGIFTQNQFDEHELEKAILSDNYQTIKQIISSISFTK